MAVREFSTEEELDEEFERIEEACFEHLHLKEAVVDAEKALEDAEKELQEFEEDNKEYLV